MPAEPIRIEIVFGPVHCSRVDALTVYRVGYKPDPWHWTPWEFGDEHGRFTGRWDDPAGIWDALPGVDWVTAGKLLAAKRPRLIQILDKEVQAFLEPKPGLFWVSMHDVLSDESRRRTIAAVCHGAPPHVSLLRRVHVEVKGTASVGAEVFLTKEEVKHARSYASTVLVVVHDIQVLYQRETVVCHGGTPRIIDPWTPADDALTPLQYKYQVPLG